MSERSVPTIFSRRRAVARIRRANALGPTDPFLWQFVAEETAERLLFVRHEAKRCLVLGSCHEPLRSQIDLAKVDTGDGSDWNLEQPFPQGEYDLIIVIGLLDAVNDLPGTLIHIRNAMAPGGLAIASFIGGASLPKLRAAMLAADGERPAARVHPMVDHRAGPQLLQRAGWKDPVVDTHKLTVRYSALDRLVHDLREHGLTSALADRPPQLTKGQVERARAAFLEQADEDGKVSETFEVLTLTGRR